MAKKKHFRGEDMEDEAFMNDNADDIIDESTDGITEDKESGGVANGTEDADEAHQECSTNSTVLSDDVAALFELNWKGGHTVFAGKFGLIDFRTLTIEKAEMLVERGFKQLVRKG